MLTKIKTQFSKLYTSLKTRAARLKAWVVRHKLLSFAAVVLGLAVVMAGLYLLGRTPAGKKLFAAAGAQQRRLSGWFKRRGNVVIVSTAVAGEPEVIPAEPILNGK